MGKKAQRVTRQLREVFTRFETYSKYFGNGQEIRRVLVSPKVYEAVYLEHGLDPQDLRTVLRIGGVGIDFDPALEGWELAIIQEVGTVPLRRGPTG